MSSATGPSRACPASFQIPMRGNELSCVVSTRGRSKGRFQIPMRGNERRVWIEAEFDHDVSNPHEG